MKLNSPKFAVVFSLLFTAAVIRSQAAATDPYAGLAHWQFGQSREPLAMIEDQIRHTAPANYPALETQLLPILTAPGTPTDAKRYICRWLSVVGSERCIPAVAALLTDKDLSHPARIALEPMPSPAAGAALRQALPKVQGRLLAGLISSIGVRRDAQAVDALSRLVNDDDPVIAEAALEALGAIGTEAAAKALSTARVRPALTRPLARARITAARHLAAAGQNRQATVIYRALTAAEQPRPIRVAALKGLIDTLPTPDAVRLILDTMQGADTALRSATLSAYADSPDAELQNAVADQLPALNAAGQRTLLTVLADLPEVAAREAVLQVLQRSPETTVQVAALKCLTRHGEGRDVPLLVKLAQSSKETLANAAQDTLQRMTHSGVDNALIQLIESPRAGDRAVVLAALGNRRVTAALPTLEQLAAGKDAALAAEAAKALGVMGGTDQLSVLGWVLVTTKDTPLRDAAAEAARAICRRAPDKSAAARQLLAALAQAQTPPARQALLPLLVVTGGAAALEAVHQATADRRPAVRDTAVRALVAWPDIAAAPHLIALARTSPNPTYAILALRDGCLRLAQMDEWPIAKRLDLYRQVLDLAKRTEEKKQAISGLAQLPALGSLKLLQTCVANSALKTDAMLAITRLAPRIGAVYLKPTLAALTQIQAQAPNAELKTKIQKTIKRVQNAGQSPEGYIVAWMLSGPYTQGAKNGSDLFDVAFPPEQPNGKAEWRPVVVARDGKPGLVELNKILGGDNRVAYLRTDITSDQAQDALLELGSDDGIKVWVNGKLVHANNATRPCSPGQDKAKAKLKAGVNTLLLKITQGGGEWAACCRLRATDGQELEDVLVAPHE